MRARALAGDDARVTPTPDPLTIELVDALESLVEALRANTERNVQAIRRAHHLIEGLRAGTSNIELVTQHDDPLIFELTRQNLEALSEAGSRVRRAQVHALHHEGMSTAQIAAVFGVTRQRISQLVQAARRQHDTGAPPEGEALDATPS